MLNADMEFYKLAGIGDIGEIVSVLDLRPETDKRGVIGIGEPCAVGVVAAIANAVANAIGVRVPRSAVDSGSRWPRSKGGPRNGLRGGPAMESCLRKSEDGEGSRSGCSVRQHGAR